MGYRLNRLDELVFMAGPKPMRTEFGIHQRLESCDSDKHYSYGLLFSEHSSIYHSQDKKLRCFKVQQSDD